MSSTDAGDLYRYQATVLDWHDGDTFHGDVDLGCRVHWHGSVRCAGYNSPELFGATKAVGLTALAYVRTVAPAGTVVYLNSLAFSAGAQSEQDSFGRMLATVTLPDGSDLAAVMVDTGHAVPL